MQQMFHIHKASSGRVSYAQPYEKYTAGGDGALVDGIKGSTYYKDGKWQGFHGNSAAFTINLGEKKNISSVKLTFLQDISVWIFMPLQVKVSVSSDGINFDKIIVMSNVAPPEKRGTLIEEFRAEFDALPAQFIKVDAVNMGTCPEGHSGAGQPAWIFLDEVIVE
jgi:hexosaminidase